LGYSFSARLGVGNLSQTGFHIISILVLFAIILSCCKLFTETHSLYRLIILVFCILTLFAAALLTQSRGVYVALIFTGITLFLDKKKYLIAFLGIMMLVFFFAPIKVRFTIDRITDDSRIPIMHVATKVVKEHPIIGIGFGMHTYGKLNLEKYETRIPQKYQGNGGKTITDPHNMVLDIAVRLGVVGLVFFFYIIFVFFKMCWDIIKHGKDNFLINWGRCLAAAFIAVSVIGLFQPIFSHMPEVVICTIFSMTTVVWRLNNLREENRGKRREGRGQEAEVGGQMSEVGNSKTAIS